MPIPISERGYAHPELLAETDLLADRLADATLRVVDARRDKDYAADRLPGSVNINGFSRGGVRPGSDMRAPDAVRGDPGACVGVGQWSPPARH